ncbi:MAG TPA: undecaprenyl-phosphate galactose phosphotransferase WbaP [Acidobacteriaceae bacterium]
MSTTTIFAPIETALPRSSTLARWLTYLSIGIADLCAILTAGVLAVIVRYLFHAEYSPGDWLTFAPSVVIFLVVFALAGLYPGLAISPIEEFRRILRASSVVFLLIIGTAFFLREGLMSSRIVFVLAWIFTIVLVPVSRRTVRGWCSLQPWWGIPTVIMGERAASTMMLNMLEGHPRIGLRPVALLIENSTADDSPITSSVFAGDLSHASALGRGHGNCYAVIAMPSRGSEQIKRVFNEYADQYRRVLIIPDLFGMTSLAVSAKDICGILALEVEQKLTRKLPQLTKRAFDLGVCMTVLLVLSPVLVLLYLAVRLTSRGPVFYGQQRIGRNERPFLVWKFRSMVADADSVLEAHLAADPALRAEWDRDHKLRRDPRVTAIGRLLRKSSMDELPQLWNVICGEMSLVGPRPIVHSEIEKYGQIFRQYRRVIPGITGLWQVSGRNNTTYEFRTQVDDYYVRNWSVSLDLYILFRTLKTVCLTEGAY